ncbi:hypothetical protein SSX86_023813 [Deinandra increscens subsp. villosa]|uniref:FAF domain-containing protein n=1 Tax=Deinandra increscens subsp. villosa TaxID=3103831 RepID=A0AAP0CMB0_9ASTR
MHTSDYLDDLIGMESCVDLDPENYSALCSARGGALDRKPRKLNKRRSSRNVKELPPPLPIQTSTEMKRYHTEDGRLIIVEEEIESPKYRITSHRSNGRLTLRLAAPESSRVPATRPCLVGC